MFVYYTSKGAGDIYIKASGTANQLSFSNDGMYLKSSVWSDVLFNVPFTKGSVVEFTAKSINSSGNRNYINVKEENASTNLFGGSFTNSGINIDIPTPAVSKSISGDKLIRIEINSDGEFSLYCNDTLVGTKTISTSSNLIFYFGTGTSSYATITDLSIKPL